MNSTSGGPPVLEPLIRCVFEKIPPSPALLALARFTYETGSFFGPAAGPGPVVFHMDAGKLTFSAEGAVYFKNTAVDRTAEIREVTPGTSFDVTPGDQLLVPGDTPHTARSSGTTTAAVMGVAMFPQVPPQQFPPGIQFIPLVLGMANALPSPPILVTLDRFTFGPGTSDGRAASGPGLVWVESGSMSAIVSSGNVQFSRAASAGPFSQPEQVAPGNPVTLGSGDGLFIQSGSSFTLRNSGTGPATVVQAITGSDTVDLRKRIAKQYFYEVWNSGNLSLVDALVAPGYVQHRPLNGQMPGPDGLRQFVKSWRTAFPDTSVSVDLCVGEGPTVATRWTARGTHRNSFLGIAPSGKPVSISGITTFRIDAGMIHEAWEHWDQAGFLLQVGAIPLRNQ